MQVVRLMKLLSLNRITTVTLQESSSYTRLLGVVGAYGMKLTKTAAALVKFVLTTNLR